MTKKAIIKELKEAGIEFDSKVTKAKLELLLPNGNVSLGEPNPTAKLEVVGKVEKFLIDKYEASYTSKGRTFILGNYATVKDANKALDQVGAHVKFIKHITK